MKLDLSVDISAPKQKTKKDTWSIRIPVSTISKIQELAPTSGIIDTLREAIVAIVDKTQAHYKKD